MPQSTATITAEQREALYELVVDHLSGVADVAIATEQGNYVIARRLAQQFSEDVCLLEDLGWAKDDDRSAVSLTMPSADLVRGLRRLGHDARAGAAEPEEVRESRQLDERGKQRFQLAAKTCDELLRVLDAAEEGIA